MTNFPQIAGFAYQGTLAQGHGVPYPGGMAITQQADESNQDFARAMTRHRGIYQFHFARIWARRHASASARKSIRYNISAQKAARDAIRAVTA